LLLSGTAAVLKSRQDMNAAFDVQRNIVKAFGLDISSATPDSIGTIFSEHISEVYFYV
jgi:Na+-transporting NADH:ubiquinone oxidoreductase subunit NqrC